MGKRAMKLQPPMVSVEVDGEGLRELMGTWMACGDSDVRIRKISQGIYQYILE